MSTLQPENALDALDRYISSGAPTKGENRGAVKLMRELLLAPRPIEVEKLYEDAKLPKAQEKGDAGTDLYSYVPEADTEDGERIEIKPGEHELIPTGLRMKLPPQTELQIRPRSGLALDHGLTVLNTPGTVDEGYRGEVGVVLINHGSVKMLIGHQERIAQAVLKPALSMEYEEVDSIDTDTERGEGGYGSTGTK